MRAEAASLQTMALQTDTLKKYPGWELVLCDVDTRIPESFLFPFCHLDRGKKMWGSCPVACSFFKNQETRIYTIKELTSSGDN